MNKINKVKFFLVAATLIASATAFAQDYDSNDPNLEIGVSGTSVVDNALKPYEEDCHNCEISARVGGPRGQLFEARGAAAIGGSSSSEDAKQ